MTIRINRYLGWAIFLTGLYVWWLMPGWWNLGFTIINSLFLWGICIFFKKRKKDKFLMFLLIGSFLLSWFMTFRSYEFVRFLGFVGIYILDVLIVTLLKKPRAKLDYGRVFRTVFVTGTKTLKESLKIVDIFKLMKKEKGKKSKAILVGIVWAIPMILVFGSLFYSADIIFAKWLDRIKLPRIEINMESLSDIINTVLFFGVVMSVYKSKLTEKVKETKIFKQITEINVAVGILEVLFLIFTCIQIKYFFVSAETLKSLGIIYSEYTRRGYFEMIVAAGLAYGIVLWLDYSLHSQRKMEMKSSKFTKMLALLMIGEIAVFILSATKRNYIYQAAYGFTRIRLLGFSLSVWMLSMLGLLLVKILKKKQMDYFVRGGIIITTVSLVLLNVLNIDRTIVLAKPASLPTGTDIEYMSELSDDAYKGWEMIVGNIEKKIYDGSVTNSEQYYELVGIVRGLLNRREGLLVQSENGWRWGGSWNSSSFWALNYLNKNEERLSLIVNKLEVIKDKLDKEEEEREVNGKTQVLDKVYVGLANSYPELVLVTPYMNGKMRILSNKQISDDSKREIRHTIEGFSYGMCYLESSEIINTKGEYMYSVACYDVISD